MTGQKTTKAVSGEPGEYTSEAEQIDRARRMAEVSYNKVFENDAYMLKFILDRLERVETANADAYETIRGIDWCL